MGDNEFSLPRLRALVEQRDDAAELTSLFQGVATSTGQMSDVQYAAIAVELLTRSPCRCLIFGAGRDTPFYAQANQGGMTCVVEHNPLWFDSAAGVPCHSVLVTYTTRIADGLLTTCPLPLGLPTWILEDGWDVIVVDGLDGFAPHCRGRQQPIALASRLCGTMTRVFIHDAQRSHEKACIARHMGEPLFEIDGRASLAAF